VRGLLLLAHSITWVKIDNLKVISVLNEYANKRLNDKIIKAVLFEFVISGPNVMGTRSNKNISYY